MSIEMIPARKQTFLLIAGIAFLTLALIVLAMATPVNHDEDQYLAAALLARHGRPFVDFLYLQTPLQLWFAAPLVGLFPGWDFVALRLATALLGAILVALTYLAARLAGADVRGASIAATGLACCHALLFCVSVVRNDALPAVLATIGIAAGLAALRRPAPALLLWAIAGVAIGAATSTKISYIVLLAGGGFFLATRMLSRQERMIAMRTGLAFAVGGAIGLLPTVASAIAAPEVFFYGVFDYAATAPFEWYLASGHERRLGLDYKLVDSLRTLLLGPALVALALIAMAALRRRRGGLPTPPKILFLDCLILAGLIAALLPTPTWRQYFLPLLPPLFARTAMILSGERRMTRPLLALWVITSIAGLAPHVWHIANVARSGRWPAVAVTQEAHWIGRMVRLANVSGQIASLSPHIVIDSGVPLDPRFATGVFFYRTGDGIDDARQRRLNVLSPRTVNRFFDERPPAAIVTGYEMYDHLDLVGLDRPLMRYGQARGYRLLRSPYGDARLYIRNLGSGPTIRAVPPD